MARTPRTIFKIILCVAILPLAGGAAGFAQDGPGRPYGSRMGTAGSHLMGMEPTLGRRLKDTGTQRSRSDLNAAGRKAAQDLFLI